MMLFHRLLYTYEKQRESRDLKRYLLLYLREIRVKISFK